MIGSFFHCIQVAVSGKALAAVVFPPVAHPKNRRLAPRRSQHFRTPALTGKAQAERGIELLQERRTALISAAVTGKIDVRGAA